MKQFAQRLVQDHTKTNQELLTIAQKKGISVPKQLDDTHKDVVKLFSKLERAQFDREYLSSQVMDHEMETAAFAVQQLPILKEHLQKARDLVAQQHTAGMSGPPTERRGKR